jgi:hypothetical protein
VGTPALEASRGDTPPAGDGTSTTKPPAKGKLNKGVLTVQHVDIIKDAFWDQRPWLMKGVAGVSRKQL